MKRTSFQKKTRAGKSSSLIPGTHTSLHNGQLLVSTGVPSLDAVIGGGLPVGCVLLIEEDYCNQYSSALLRYYLAEGLVCGHSSYIVSTNQNEFIAQLPQPISEDTKQLDAAGDKDDLKIAWRYEKNPQIQSSMATTIKYGHYYDISKTMNQSIVDKSEIEQLNVMKSNEENKYKFTAKKLMAYITENKKDVQGAVASGKPLNILRVAVSSVGSPLWQIDGENEQKSAQNIAEFLLSLRAIMRKSLGVCCVSIPTRLYEDKNLDTFRHLVDVSVHLESFKSGKPNPLFKEYHGMFYIKKLPLLNSILPFMPDALDLGFKMKRKKFTIEKLHLPPDIVENSEGKGDSSISCGGSAMKSNLDF